MTTLTLKELQEARAEFQAKVEAATHQCSEFYSAFTGLVKCPCKALRTITYVDLSGDTVSGDYCARHAIELKRRERLGELEIMADEPLYPEIFDRRAAGREIGMKGFYGV